MNCPATGTLFNLMFQLDDERAINLIHKYLYGRSQRRVFLHYDNERK
jgi:uncharacterized C2H2 Zn-finger protein